LIAMTAIIGGISAGLSGCSVSGADKEVQMQANLANQRKVAVKLVENYPHPALERIEFTNAGSIDGAGTWAANAIVTVAGHEHREILGTFVSGGDELPAIESEATGRPVTLVYSDGASEVLQ
jgi:hypothetical protein